MDGVKQLEFFLASFFSVLPRVLAVFAFLPFLPQSIPQFVIRTGLALALSVFFLPISQEWGGWVRLDTLTLILFLIKEVAIGTLMGFCLGAVWYAASSAGSVIDTVAGTNNGNLLDPITNQEQGVWGASLSVFVTSVIMIFGGIQLVVSTLIWSFNVLPLGSWLVPSTKRLPEIAVWLADYSLGTGMMIAAPFLVILGLIDICFGFLARNIPQFGGATLTAGIKGAITILLMILGFHSFLTLIIAQQSSLAGVIKTLFAIPKL
jgi:type III secretory pathway component EscT